MKVNVILSSNIFSDLIHAETPLNSGKRAQTQYKKNDTSNEIINISCFLGNQQVVLELQSPDTDIMYLKKNFYISFCDRSSNQSWEVGQWLAPRIPCMVWLNDDMSNLECIWCISLQSVEQCKAKNISGLVQCEHKYYFGVFWMITKFTNPLLSKRPFRSSYNAHMPSVVLDRLLL